MRYLGISSNGTMSWRLFCVDSLRLDQISRCHTNGTSSVVHAELKIKKHLQLTGFEVTASHFILLACKIPDSDPGDLSPMTSAYPRDECTGGGRREWRPTSRRRETKGR